VTKPLDLVRRAYAAFLYWKWDREFYAADRRMRGCAHTRTGFVDVGVVCEKCRDCWALRLPAVDGSGVLQWTPNTASPRHARWVSAPEETAGA
jgi:hypothetical protein